MNLDDFVIRFERASAYAETALLAHGMICPSFAVVNRLGHTRPVAVDFTSEAAKEASLAIVRMMCVAEAAIAVFHCTEAWAVLGDVSLDGDPSQSGQRIEVLLLTGTVRLNGGLTQKLRVREIERDLSGAVSGLRDIPVSALGGVDIQHLPLQGRIMELLLVKTPTLIDRWRARGRVVYAAKRLNL